MLRRLETAQLTINTDHRVDENGICPLEKTVAAIRDLPMPDSKTQLQRFLWHGEYLLTLHAQVRGDPLPTD